MKAKSNQLTVESMTQRYSLGHKALSVALSVVLMGFGWPAVSPSQVYAGDGAAADDAAAQVEGASSAAATSTADKAADAAASSAASATSSAAPAASEQPASTTSQQQAAPSASVPAQPAATQRDESAKEDADTADVELVLGNASIAYMNQVVSAPAHKLTVPVNDDFKFTVSPDNGYSLTKAVLKVSGKENPICPDEQGVYTVSAADVAAGATVTLETEAVSSDSGKDNAAVSIEDDAEEDDATEKTQASVSGAGAISGPTSIAQGDEVTLADSTKKPDNTDFEKWIYVDESVDLVGDENAWWGESWTVSSGSENVKLSGSSSGLRTATGREVGDATVQREYYALGWHTETFTIHVMKKPAATSLSIFGPETDTVEQFKNITLTTDSDTDVTWTSSDPSVATIDASGKVVGVKAGRVTITATTVTAEGKVLTATYELTVAESKASATNCYLFFQNSPTANPDSNGTASWFPSGGKHALGVKVNLDGLNLPGGKNSYDNVANRVTQWPDGSTGSSWVLDRNGAYSQYWNAVFRAWKDTLSKEQGTQITEDDVEEIALYPYKISNNTNVGCGYHLDCKVVVKCNKAINAVFYLQDADASGFAQYDAATYKLEKGIAQVAAPSKTPADEKTVNGVKYKFMGWCSDQACTQAVSFPMRTSENVNYYGKYVACDQSIQVNYYLEGTTTQVAPSKTLSGYMKGQTVVQSPISIEGYKPVSDETKSGVVGNDSSIDFYYTANPVNYSIEYYWTGSDTPISSEKRSGHVGDQVTGLAPKAIAGYTPVSDNVQDLKLGADESQNVVKFYYRQNVSLKANSDSKTYNGSEQGVDGYTTNLPEGVSASFDGVMLEGGKGTNAGDYPYTFANGTIGKVSSDNNYVVTQTTPGNLHIGPVTDEVTITISGHNGGEKYSGEEQSVSGYDVSGLPAGVGEGDISFTGKAEAKGTDAGEYKMGLAEMQFSLKGDAAKNYVNVKFRVERDGVLTIGKRTVILTSEGGHKNYDGKTLQRRTDISKNVGGDGFVGEDGVLAKDKLTWYDENNILPGTYENKFDPAYTPSTKLNNYDVQLVFGELVVNARTGKDKYAITVTACSNTVTYDGEEHTVSGVTGDTYTNENKVTFTVEGMSASVSGTDAGTYTNKVVGTPVVKDPHGNDVTNQFKITTEDGKLTIDKRSVTITAGSAEKEYDGSALTADQADPKFTTDGFVDGQDISDVTVEGSQTQCGTSASTIKDKSWKFQKGTNGNNYSVTTKQGTLTVKHRSDDKKYAITLTGKSDTVPSYDGEEHTVSGVEQDRWTFDGVEYTVSNYRANASGTDAGTYSNIVTSDERGYKVTDLNGNDVTKEFSISVAPGTLTIKPAEVTVTAGSATRAYNGSALTAAEAEHEFTAEGFVGEDSIASAMVDGSITDVGEIESNVAQNSVVLKNGTKASNYNITYKPGKLEVTPVTDEVVVTIAENSGNEEYNGSEQSVEGYELPSISNSNYAATDIAFVGSADDQVAKGTDAGTYEMNLKPEDFKNNSANFTNVKFQIVDGSLTITKCAVTLTSATPAEKTYDGNPLEDHNVSVTSGNHLVAGDKFVADVTGSQTNAGSSANAFTYKLVDAAGNELAKDAEGAYRNYNVTKVEGVLKVNPMSEEVVVTIAGNHAEGAYNGKPLTATGYTFASSNALYTSAKVAFSGENSVSRIDAGTTDMDLQGKFTNADAVNFPNVRFDITNGSVAISKAKVTLQSANLEKEYDGTALTNKNGGEGQTPLAKESGWAEGEGAAYTFTGSQTLVGGSPNAFDYALKDNTKADNYEISVIFGQLTVTNRQAQYQVTVEANSSTGNTYDGVEHAATGLKTSEFTVDGQKYTVEGLNTSDPKAVNAGEYANTISGTPVVKDANGNDVSSQFAVTLVPGKLEIAKRSVTLTSASDSRVYNGEALTNDDVTVGGDGFVAGEGAVYNVTGTITDAGKVANSFTYERNSNTNFDNYNISKKEGTLEVTPVADKVTVTITGNSATLQYSGSEQSVAGYSFATSDNRYREANVKFQGEAVAKGTNAGTYNMNLASGQFSNTSGNFTNVEFVVVDGSLEITGGDLDAGKVVWDVHDVQKVYDGTPLSAYVAKATDKFGNALKVEYSTDGKQWTDDPSSITLTHFGAQLVMLRATGANYAAGQYAENKDGEWVAITSRPVKLTSKGDNKKYDGEPLTNDTVTVETKGEGTGFIDGEGVTIKVTGSQTDAGESDNTFDYTFNEGTNASDYWVTTRFGKLVVTASDSEVVATIAGHNKTVEYNGLEQSVEGYDFVEASSKLYGEGDFAFSGTAVAKGTDVGTYKMNLASEQFANTSKNFSKVTFAVTDGTLTITPKSIVPDPENPKNTMSVDSPADVVYNGQDQTWTPVVKDGERTLEAGKDYTVEYNTADRTNVIGEISVTITGINNYSGKVERTYQITKRTVDLKSKGGSKPYDGTALVKPEVSGWQQLGDTGFVEGEVSNVRATGSVTTVAQGEVTNSIAYDTNAGFNANNYAISKEEGKLSITALAAEGGITITPYNATYIYNASSREAGAAAASASVAGTDVNLEYRVKGSADTEWRSNPSAITAINAGTLTVEVRASAANYSGYKYAEQTLTIQKRDVELTSASASKVYDGAPLTKDWVDMGPNRPDTGFIWTDLAGDGQVHATGSQTEVGSSENAISYKLKDGAENNYNIIGKHVGTLAVTAQSIAPDPQNPDSYKGVAIDEPNDHVYDGEEHKWAPVVTDKDGNKLIEGVDYTVAYDTDDFVNVKVVNVTITGTGNYGKGNYTGTCVKAYEITKAPLTVNAESASKVYDGEALTAGATIEGLVGGETATAQTQGSQTEVGTSDNTVTGDITWDTAKEGNYYIAAQNDGTLTITPKGIAQMTVGSLPDVTYNGESQQQKPVVKDGEKVLVEGVDYELTHSENTTDAGSVTVTVVGKGNYAGSVDVAYRIVPAPLMVTTPSASRVYNGNALTAAGSVSGFVNGESAPFETTGSQTEVGTSDNTYAIDWAAANATAKQANYTVSETVGKLTVTEFAGRVVATPGSYSGTYDGQAHGVDVTVSGLPEGYSAKAARSNATATDATDEAGVTASVDELVIVNAQGEDVTDKLDIEKQVGAIKIAPAEYYVVTEGAFKVYDGTALTAPGKIVGLVNGEEASLSVTGSQTDAGSSANAYAIAFDKSAKEGNYVHGADAIGSLEVAAAKAEGKISLSGSSASKVYDGKPLAAKAATAAVPTQDAVTIEYSLDGENWMTDPGSLVATDVADSAMVQLRASSLGNYEGYVYGSQQLSVTKRAVNLKSDSASKVFDGTALTRPEVVGWKQLGDEGFVDGQVSAVRATGSATHVSDGKVANTIVYTESEGFNADNYAISKDEGVLSVTAKQIAAADMTVRAPADVVYSGKAQQQKPVVKDGDKVLVEGVDYELTYPGNATDAGTVTVTVTGKGDYAGSVDVAYQIAPAPLTVATESANKVYDGKPLTADGKVDGLVNGETVAFKVVGSQTKVGESDNAYKIEWSGTAKRANYRLEAETIGKLTVTESADEVVVTTTGGTFTYDGASHGATVKVANLPEGYSLETAESAASVKDVSDGEVAATADVLVIKNAQGEDVTSKLNVKFVDGTIKVEPAKLTVTTPSVTKVFDGDALAAEGRVSGFVNGEAATFKTTGSQTEVGSSVNGYELVWDGSAQAANYTVEENLGTLTVSAQSINPDDAGAFGGVTVGYLADTVYNGADQRFEPEVVDKDGKALVKGLDYELSFSGDVKNVGEVTVTVIGKGNFAGSVERTYRITPAPLAVTTGSDSKIYDGSELTNSELSIEGLQGEDRVTAATTGSQTEVGSSENTYRITSGDVDAANYVIDEHLGTLTVTPAPVPPTPNPDDGTTPTPEPTPSPTPGDGSTPGTTPDGTTPASASTPAPAAAGPLDALAGVLEGAYESVTGSPEADNPVEEERIYDAENPLGRESVEDHCWVHWYMIVGMVLTAVYGLAAALRRKNHERKLRNDMNDVLGDGDGKDPSGSPAAKPAGMEA